VGGLFCLLRSVGILAHAWAESQSGLRNKGRIPRERLWRYDGPARRLVPDADQGASS
jgi:citrate synthase